MQISALNDGAMYPLCLRVKLKDAPKSEKIVTKTYYG